MDLRWVEVLEARGVFLPGNLLGAGETLDVEGGIGTGYEPLGKARAASTAAAPASRSSAGMIPLARAVRVIICSGESGMW